MSLKLFSYYRSSAAFRVRIALELKKLPFEYQAVHLLSGGGEQHRPEYKEKNPMAEVPCLLVDSVPLGQSMAIIQFLDESYPEPPLFPRSPIDKAQVIQLCEIVNSGLHPMQNLKLLQELENRFGLTSEGKETWVQHWITKGFHGLERTLKSTSGLYSFGDIITAADCFVVPQVFTAKRFNTNLAPFPIIEKITENCMKLEAFQRAQPDQQPDAPRP